MLRNELFFAANFFLTVCKSSYTYKLVSTTNSHPTVLKLGKGVVALIVPLTLVRLSYDILADPIRFWTG